MIPNKQLATVDTCSYSQRKPYVDHGVLGHNTDIIVERTNGRCPGEDTRTIHYTEEVHTQLPPLTASKSI